jgi:hypothetical protein
MLCNTTISFITIIIAYILVSLFGYNNIPSALFLLLFIAISGFIELVCMTLGEIFGWIIILLVIVCIIFINIFSKTPATIPSCNDEKPSCCSYN